MGIATTRAVGFSVALLAGILQTLPTQAQSRRPPRVAAARILTVDTVRLTPVSPTEGSLCQLAVAVTNHGGQPVSRFRLGVKVNGRAVDAYTLTRYLQTIEPGQTRELRLFNVRAARGETGALRVEVAILGAEYVAATVEPDGVRTWRSEKPVPGLPASAQKTVRLGGPAKRSLRPASVEDLRPPRWPFCLLCPAPRGEPS